MGFEQGIAIYGALVDFKTAGVHAIGTTEVPGGALDPNMRASPFLVVLSVTNGNSLLTIPVFSIGFLPAAYDEILGSTTLPVGVASGSDQALYLAKQDSVDMGDATDIKINITTAATTASGPFDVKVMVLAFPFSRAG